MLERDEHFVYRAVQNQGDRAIISDKHERDKIPVELFSTLLVVISLGSFSTKKSSLKLYL